MRTSELTERHLRVIRAYQNGTSWHRACLESGFTSYAKLGPSASRRQCKAFDQAFRQILHGPVKAEEVKMLVRGRLLENLRQGEDRAVRSAELLGRDKSVDMWVRPADVQIGIFQGIPTPEGAALLDALEPEQPTSSKRLENTGTPEQDVLSDAGEE